MKKSGQFPKQRVRDPVHDLIVFDTGQFENGLWEKIVQSEPFQRLRRIKQLGFSDFVFPGATHSRFAHSLGVFHIANRLMKVIKLDLGDENYDEIKAKSAITAALLHDLGHGPFSHAFEKVCLNLEGAPKNHEEVTKRLINEYNFEFDTFGAGTTDQIIQHIESPQTIYGAVVSSQFDADRLDYMQRDCLMTGSKHPGIDFNWLVDNMEVADYTSGTDKESSGKKKQTLVIGSKARYAAETYIMSLFQLYPTIYFHKTTRGIEVLFRSMLKRVFDMVLKNTYKQEDLGLFPEHPLIKFIKAPNNLDNYLALDDMVIWSSLPLLKNSTDHFVKNVAERLLIRKLYKAHDIRSQFLDTALKKWPRKNNLLDESNFEQQRSHFITKAQAKLKDKITNIIDTKPKFKETLLLDDDHRDLYKQDSKEAIYVGPSISALPHEDIGKFSSIISVPYRYEFFRVYTPDKCCDSAKFLEKAIKESINDAFL